MDEPPAADRQPTIVQRHVRGRVCLVIHPAAAQSLDRGLLFDLPVVLAGRPGRSTRQQGRTTCWRWKPGGENGPAYWVRLYAHGGLLGPLLGTLFLGARRMVREFEMALTAASRGVPTARPAALRVERVVGPLVRAHLVTAEVAGAVDMLDLCSGHVGRDLSARARRRLARAVGECIAAMHGAGIVHADLNLKNILVRGAASERPEAFIIDFDGARTRRAISDRERRENLARLDRSVRKWPASRQTISLLDRLRTTRAYWAAVRTTARTEG